MRSRDAEPRCGLSSRWECSGCRYRERWVIKRRLEIGDEPSVSTAAFKATFQESLGSVSLRQLPTPGASVSASASVLCDAGSPSPGGCEEREKKNCEEGRRDGIVSEFNSLEIDQSESYDCSSHCHKMTRARLELSTLLSHSRLGV